jgi:hypothetical protein
VHLRAEGGAVIDRLDPGTDDWRRGFHGAMRVFMERYGIAVDIDPDAEYAWEEVSTYGWEYVEAHRHVHPYKAEGCSWHLAEDAVITNRTYSMFTDTFHDSKDEVGMNMGPAACACGAFTDITLRYTGTFGDIMPRLLGIGQ